MKIAFDKALEETGITLKRDDYDYIETHCILVPEATGIDPILLLESKLTKILNSKELASRITHLTCENIENQKKNIK